jgi:hypothetical protein
MGDPDLDVTCGEFRDSAHLLGGDEVVICPPLYSPKVDIQVFAYNGLSAYQIVVKEYPHAIVPSQDPFRPTPSSSIGDGEKHHVTLGVSFGIDPMLKLSCFFHVESVGMTSLSLVLGNTTYGVTSNYNGRSYADISLCGFNSSEIVNNVHISLYYQNEYDLFVTSSNATELTSLYSLYLIDGVTRMSSDVHVRYQQLDSSTVSQVWSSVSRNPFNPPQKFLFADSVPFAEIDWGLPTRAEGGGDDERVLYTYLLLDGDYHGSAAEVMESFGFSIGPSIVDRDGRRISDGGVIYSSPKANISCQSDQVDELLSIVDETLTEIVNLKVADVLDIYGSLVRLGIVQSNQTWIACARQLELLSKNTTVNAADMCDDWNCTSIFLENYRFNQLQIDGGSCEGTSKNALDSYADEAWYKRCKESVYSVETEKKGRPCVTDEDCFFPWGNSPNVTYLSLNNVCVLNVSTSEKSQCNTIAGICTDTHQSAENLFWWCFVNSMTTDFQLTLMIHKNIDPCDATQMRDYFSISDCVPLFRIGMDTRNYRSHYSYVSPVTSPHLDISQLSDGIVSDPIRDHCACFHSIGNEYDLCEDLLCNRPSPCEYTSYDRAPTTLLLPSEASEKNDVCTYTYVRRSSQFEACQSEMRCNWNAELAPDSYNMVDCVFGEENFFCGGHFRLSSSSPSNFHFFYEIVNVPQGDCESHGDVCVLPLGSFAWSIHDSAECAAIGYCDAECPNEMQVEKCLPSDRERPSLCINNSVDPNWCAYLSGTWIEDGTSDLNGVCVFSLQNNRDECARNNNTFVSCALLSRSECESNSYVSCYLTNSSTLCESKASCEQRGRGYCTDSEYFMNDVTNPPTNGSCVLPFLMAADENRRYCYLNTIPMSFGSVSFSINWYFPSLPTDFIFSDVSIITY